jgi:amidase
MRIGLMTGASARKVHPDCAAAVDSVGRLLESLGHRVELSHPALEDPELAVGFGRVGPSAQARLIEQFSAAIGKTIRAEDMNSDNWAVTEIGWKVSGTEYLAGVEALNRYTRRVAAWWEGGFDLLVTTTIQEPPPPLGELVPIPGEPLKGIRRSAELCAFTMPFNVTGQPAISLPVHWTAQGLPIGVQLIAPFGREDLLLRVGSQLEQAVRWNERRPGVCG